HNRCSPASWLLQDGNRAPFLGASLLAKRDSSSVEPHTYPEDFAMHPFSFATTAQLICETGSSRRLAGLCKEHGARSVLVVTDPGITRFGLLDEVLPGFENEGLPVAVYDQVVADPPEDIVLAAVEQAKSSGADLVIGFGGGSSMDVAKLVALLAHPQCSQSLQDIYGVGNARGQRLPLIQVPTTAGT